MAQMSDYLENKLVDHVFRNTTFTTPGVIHLALFNTDPLDDASGTELTDALSPAYVRITISMGAPANGVSINDSELLFPAATGDWELITHVAIFDESTGGNMLMHKALTSPVAVLNTNNFRIPIGDLELTFA